MQPRRLLDPLLLTVFQVTKRGWSSIVERWIFASFSRRPREKNEDRDDDFEVAEEVSLGMEGVELVEGTEEELAVDGLGASKRLIATGR